MQTKIKVAAASAAALAILAGGLAIALPAQAAPGSRSGSVVEPVDAPDTDNVQVEDGTNDGEGADGTGTDSAGTENTSDDGGGVAVEDGPQD
ncbi:hypothetical protein BH09ACT4_BH09ACT4_10310 [soil metagenome]